MNFIEFESKEKLRGGFYTNPSIAAFLVRWVKGCAPRSILEPSCGDGAFLEAIAKEKIQKLQKVTACELDVDEAEKARSKIGSKGNVIHTDFLRWYLFGKGREDLFDAVVGNPPFIRYQYLPKEQQFLAEKIFTQLGLPFTKHTNAWVPFVLASIELLRPGGRIAMVLPSEIFHIPYAQALRRYLAKQCSRILVFDPEEICFDNTLQGVVFLLAEKKKEVTEKGRGVAIVPLSGRPALFGNPETYCQAATFTNGITIEGKWMPVFLSIAERALLSQLRESKDVKRFSEIASVDVGIVTGANNFFLVPDNVVDEFSLHQWAHPMFGRSGHVRGLVYSKKDHALNRETGLPANFLWFHKERLEGLPKKARQYLNLGLDQKLHTRFKCRTRKVWYEVPSVYSAPIAMLKRAHHFPRLVLNSADAYTTDTAYRIQPLGVEPEALVFGFINSLTSLSAEIEGRHYGGGVLELVPSEIERLLLPKITATISELHTADQRFRHAEGDEEYLRTQDKTILGKIGLKKSEQDLLHNAWIKLRNRRHRVPSNEEMQSLVSNID